MLSFESNAYSLVSSCRLYLSPIDFPLQVNYDLLLLSRLLIIDIKKVIDISKMLTVNTVPIGGLNVSTRADIIPYLEKIDLSQILSHTPNFSINIFFRAFRLIS